MSMNATTAGRPATAHRANPPDVGTDIGSLRATREQVVGRPLAVVLGLLTIFGPISMDLYLAVLRDVAPIP